MTEHEGQPFGAWLVTQHNRDDYIGALAKSARTDRGFPKAGSAEDVRVYLSKLQADPDSFEALDDAENDWLCH